MNNKLSTKIMGEKFWEFLKEGKISSTIGSGLHDTVCYSLSKEFFSICKILHIVYFLFSLMCGAC